MKTLKYPFNQSCSKGLNKRLYPFFYGAVRWTLSSGMRTKTLFWKMWPNLPTEKAYFLVSFSTIWSYVSFVFKMFIWFDFLLDPFCFCEEVNTFFEEKRMWFFLFSVTLFIAFTKCNQWMVLVLSNDVPSMCFSSQPFAGWEDTFWQSPEP